MRISIAGVIKLPKFFNPLVKAISHFGYQTSKQKRFSSQVQAAIMSSREEALRRHHDSIETEHLLLSIIKQSQSRTAEILKILGCDPTILQRELEDAMTNYNHRKPNANIPFSKQAVNVLELACGIADALDSAAIETEHLFLAMLKQENSLLVQKLGISYEIFYNQLKKFLAN